MESAAILALIGILGSTMVALFKLLNNNTKAIKSLDEGSRERNGHLGEMVTRQIEIAIENKDQIVSQISGLTIDKQTVHNQTVEHEHVINKE